MSLLPSAVRSRLVTLSEGVKRADLTARTGKITETYRNKRNSASSLLTPDDALAYAMTRMPATFAATIKAMQALVDASDAIAPATVLDVGCGPGTASIAALQLFPTAQTITLMDRNGPFLKLAEDLVESMLTGQQKTLVDCDIQRQSVFPAADLVLASYVMVEMGAAASITLAGKLWSSAKQALLLVEPGTPEGFNRLRDIRANLVGQGAIVAAPCTHENTCPKASTANDWCRFMARVQRSRDHKMLKQATLGFEDEPFAYLALVREPANLRTEYRIVGRNITTKIGVSLPACGKAGFETLYASKRETEKHRYFKKLDWSDPVENLIPAVHAEDKD